MKFNECHEAEMISNYNNKLKILNYKLQDIKNSIEVYFEENYRCYDR